MMINNQPLDSKSFFRHRHRASPSPPWAQLFGLHRHIDPNLAAKQRLKSKTPKNTMRKVSKFQSVWMINRIVHFWILHCLKSITPANSVRFVGCVNHWIWMFFSIVLLNFSNKPPLPNPKCTGNENPSTASLLEINHTKFRTPCWMYLFDSARPSSHH